MFRRQKSLFAAILEWRLAAVPATPAKRWGLSRRPPLVFAAVLRDTEDLPPAGCRFAHDTEEVLHNNVARVEPS
jgi:hypothetical protein